MNHTEDLQKEIENLRERLSRLSRASLRIAVDLDLDAVLQETVDGARALTGARYGVLAVLDDSGQVAALLASGLTAEEFQAGLYAFFESKAAWDDKPSPSFMNAIALVRRQLWLTSQVFSRSGVKPDSQKVQPLYTIHSWSPLLTPLENA